MGTSRSCREDNLDDDDYETVNDIAEENDLAESNPELVSTFEKLFAEAHTPSEWKTRGNLNNPEAERREFRER